MPKQENSWSLGKTIPMHVGFWDEKSDNKANTNVIPLNLNSGKTVTNDKGYFN